MADSTLNLFVASVADAAALAAHVPSPPTPAAGPDPGYFAFQRDNNTSWAWDSGAVAWVAVGGAGGALPASVQGDIFYASGTNTVAALAKNASATRYLSNTGGSNNPAWAQVALATGVSGTLPIANGGTGVAAAFSPMLVASTSLTNAQIIALPATPITLVAAPAANSRIKIVAPVTLIANFAAGAYTGIDTSAGSLVVESPSADWLSGALANDDTLTTPLDTLTLFFNGANKVVDLPVPYMEAFTGNASGDGQWIQPFGIATANLDADLIRLTLDNNSSATPLGGGNAANSLIVRVYYVVESLV